MIAHLTSRSNEELYENSDEFIDTWSAHLPIGKIGEYTEEQQVIATLVFFEIFDFCLNIDELQRFLLGKMIDKNRLRTMLRDNNKIGSREGYFFLLGSEALVEKRLLQNKIAEKFWKKVRIFVPILQLIPFIKLVGVCNNLAFGSVTEKSDIDLFIITKKNRLFIARILSTALFHILGVRRHGGKIAQRFCLSFYISEEAQDFSKLLCQPYDIYFAFWLRSLCPIIGKEQYINLLENNPWLKGYFHSWQHQIHSMKNSSHLSGLHIYFMKILQRFFELFFSGKFGDFIEKKLENYFVRRHLSSIKDLPGNSSVIVSNTILKYHNDDKRLIIREKFEDKLKRLNL